MRHPAFIVAATPTAAVAISVNDQPLEFHWYHSRGLSLRGAGLVELVSSRCLMNANQWLAQ